MPFPLRKLFALWLVLLFYSRFPLLASAQQGRATGVLPSTPSLRQLTRSSGYIFAGTVTAVGHVSATGPNELATMRITFRVEQAIRGVRAGQTLVIREWCGLWESGQRYRRGERVLLFLYRPSKLGLTSAVGGPLGRFVIDSNGQVVLNQNVFEEEQASAFPRPRRSQRVCEVKPASAAVILSAQSGARPRSKP
jgi:hypothetical protein